MKHYEGILSRFKITCVLCFFGALLVGCSTHKAELIIEPVLETVPVIEYTGAAIIAIDQEFNLHDYLSVYYIKDGDKVYLEDTDEHYFVNLYRYEIRLKNSSLQHIDTKVPGLYEITVDAVNDQGIHKVKTFEIEVKESEELG